MRWCRIADDNEARPLVREELTDPQVLARLIQYADIVRGAIDKGTGDVLRTAGFRNSSDRTASARTSNSTGTTLRSAGWASILPQWCKYETGPVWLHFGWRDGQVERVKVSLAAWVSA